MVVICPRLATAFSILSIAMPLLGLASGPCSPITRLLVGIGIWVAADTQRKKMFVFSHVLSYWSVMKKDMKEEFLATNLFPCPECCHWFACS